METIHITVKKLFQKEGNKPFKITALEGGQFSTWNDKVISSPSLKAAKIGTRLILEVEKEDDYAGQKQYLITACKGSAPTAQAEQAPKPAKQETAIDPEAYITANFNESLEFVCKMYTCSPKVAMNAYSHMIGEVMHERYGLDQTIAIQKSKLVRP